MNPMEVPTEMFTFWFWLLRTFSIDNTSLQETCSFFLLLNIKDLATFNKLAISKLLWLVSSNTSMACFFHFQLPCNTSDRTENFNIWHGLYSIALGSIIYSRYRFHLYSQISVFVFILYIFIFNQHYI